ncbi:MAG: hypothetical protein ACFE9D_01485 [Promethearchaeota archaeon]
MDEKLRFKNEHDLKLGHVKGDLELNNCRHVHPEKGDIIVVDGRVSVRGDVIFEGSLQAEYLEIHGDNSSEIHGDLLVARAVNVRRGQLAITGSTTANRFEINAALSVGKDLQATKVSIGGALKVGGNATVEEIKVGGAVKIEGKIDSKSLEVGGAAKCNTGIIGKVDVGGSFKADGAVEIGSIDVGGAVVVGPGSKVIRIDVGGSFKSDGEVTFEDLDVGGAAKFGGDAIGKSIDVGGAVSGEGSITLAEKLDVGGSVVVTKNLIVAKEIEVGGSLRAGDKIESPRIDIGGLIQGTHIIAEQFRIGRRGEVSGFVEATDITVEENARGASFYGDSIRVEEQARVKNLYGRQIYIERDVRVEGEVLYTEGLETEPGVHFSKEPEQVKKLPRPEDLLK